MKGLPRRPDDWLPHEPMVRISDEQNQNGQYELTLEMGGKVVSRELVKDQEAAHAAIARFQALVEARVKEFNANQGKGV